MPYPLSFEAYSSALQRGTLLGLACSDCSAVTCPPKMTCQQCGGRKLTVVELEKAGTIRTFTTSYVAPLGREAETPYTIVMVALDQGPWIAGNLAGIAPAEVDMSIIGRRVGIGGQVYPGDLYSAGEAARPLFSLEGTDGNSGAFQKKS